MVVAEAGRRRSMIRGSGVVVMASAVGGLVSSLRAADNNSAGNN